MVVLLEDFEQVLLAELVEHELKCLCLGSTVRPASVANLSTSREQFIYFTIV